MAPLYAANDVNIAVRHNCDLWLQTKLCIVSRVATYVLKTCPLSFWKVTSEDALDPVTTNDVKALSSRRHLHTESCYYELFWCMHLTSSIGCDTYVEEGQRVSRVPPRSSHARAPAFPKLFGTSYTRSHGMRNKKISWCWQRARRV